LLSLIQNSSKLYADRFHIELAGAPVSSPELTFTLSIGEVVIILVVIALILLVIIINRTEAASRKTEQHYIPPPFATKECPARFGFLHRLPRGGTIPEECYVCPQLVECLGFQRTTRI